MTGRRLWIGGGLLVIVVVLVLGWFFAISPTLDRAGVADLARQGVEQQNRLLGAQNAAMNGLDEAALRARVEEIAAEFPPELQAPELIRQLGAAVTGAGASIISLGIGDAQAFGAAGASTTTGSSGGSSTATASPTSGADAAAATKAGFVIVPLTIGLSGSRDAVLAAVTALQALPRNVLVTGVSVSEAAGTAAGGSAAPSASISALVWVLP